MKKYKKDDFPVDKIRRFLEPGPIVLVSSAHGGEQNMMTMGWHMMLGYDHIGCHIWDQNHSRELIHKSKECVLNVPTFDLIDAVIGIGNNHGPEIDKFETFGLTPEKAKKVDAPLIAECFANFECRLVDDSQVKKYSLFIFECVSGQRRRSARYTEDGRLSVDNNQSERTLRLIAVGRSNWKFVGSAEAGESRSGRPTGRRCRWGRGDGHDVTSPRCRPTGRRTRTRGTARCPRRPAPEPVGPCRRGERDEPEDEERDHGDTEAVANMLDEPDGEGGHSAIGADGDERRHRLRPPRRAAARR